MSEHAREIKLIVRGKTAVRAVAEASVGDSDARADVLAVIARAERDRLGADARRDGRGISGEGDARACRIALEVRRAVVHTGIALAIAVSGDLRHGNNGGSDLPRLGRSLRLQSEGAVSYGSRNIHGVIAHIRGRTRAGIRCHGGTARRGSVTVVVLDRRKAPRLRRGAHRMRRSVIDHGEVAVAVAGERPSIAIDRLGGHIPIEGSGGERIVRVRRHTRLQSEVDQTAAIRIVIMVLTREEDCVIGIRDVEARRAAYELILGVSISVLSVAEARGREEDGTTVARLGKRDGLTRDDATDRNLETLINVITHGDKAHRVRRTIRIGIISRKGEARRRAIRHVGKVRIEAQGLLCDIQCRRIVRDGVVSDVGARCARRDGELTRVRASIARRIAHRNGITVVDPIIGSARRARRKGIAERPDPAVIRRGEGDARSARQSILAVRRAPSHRDILRRDRAEGEGGALRGMTVRIVEAVIAVTDRDRDFLILADVLRAFFIAVDRACGEVGRAVARRDTAIRDGARDRRRMIIDLGSDRRDREGSRLDLEGGGSIRRNDIVIADIARIHGSRIELHAAAVLDIHRGVIRRAGGAGRDREIASRHAGIEDDADRHSVAVADIIRSERDAMRFLIIGDRAGDRGERIPARGIRRRPRKTDRATRDRDLRRTREAVVRVAGCGSHAVRAGIRAVARPRVRIGDGVARVRLIIARRALACRLRRKSERGGHRPELLIIRRREVRRVRRACSIRRLGIIRRGPSDRDRLRIDGEAHARILRQGVIREEEAAVIRKRLHLCGVVALIHALNGIGACRDGGRAVRRDFRGIGPSGSPRILQRDGRRLTGDEAVDRVGMTLLGLIIGEAALRPRDGQCFRFDAPRFGPIRRRGELIVRSDAAIRAGDDLRDRDAVTAAIHSLVLRIAARAEVRGVARGACRHRSGIHPRSRAAVLDADADGLAAHLTRDRHRDADLRAGIRINIHACGDDGGVDAVIGAYVRKGKAQRHRRDGRRVRAIRDARAGERIVRRLARTVGLHESNGGGGRNVLAVIGGGNRNGLAIDARHNGSGILREGDGRTQTVIREVRRAVIHFRVGTCDRERFRGDFHGRRGVHQGVVLVGGLDGDVIRADICGRRGERARRDFISQRAALVCTRRSGSISKSVARPLARPRRREGPSLAVIDVSEIRIAARDARAARRAVLDRPCDGDVLRIDDEARRRGGGDIIVRAVRAARIARSDRIGIRACVRRVVIHVIRSLGAADRDILAARDDHRDAVAREDARRHKPDACFFARIIGISETGHISASAGLQASDGERCSLDDTAGSRDGALSVREEIVRRFRAADRRRDGLARANVLRVVERGDRHRAAVRRKDAAGSQGEFVIRPCAVVLSGLVTPSGDGDLTRRDRPSLRSLREGIHRGRAGSAARRDRRRVRAHRVMRIVGDASAIRISVSAQDSGGDIRRVAVDGVTVVIGDARRKALRRRRRLHISRRRIVLRFEGLAVVHKPVCIIRQGPSVAADGLPCDRPSHREGIPSVIIGGACCDDSRAARRAARILRAHEDHRSPAIGREAFAPSAEGALRAVRSLRIALLRATCNIEVIRIRSRREDERDRVAAEETGRREDIALPNAIARARISRVSALIIGGGRRARIVGVEVKGGSPIRHEARRLRKGHRLLLDRPGSIEGLVGRPLIVL